jgi:hypothetical protein
LIFEFAYCLVFVAWDLEFGGDGHWGGGAMMPRYIRYIDKRKLAGIIKPSYFGKLLIYLLTK